MGDDLLKQYHTSLFLQGSDISPFYGENQCSLHSAEWANSGPKWERHLCQEKQTNKKHKKHVAVVVVSKLYSIPGGVGLSWQVYVDLVFKDLSELFQSKKFESELRPYTKANRHVIGWSHIQGIRKRICLLSKNCADHYV